MGYYSYFSLDVDTGNHSVSKIANYLLENQGDYYGFYVTEDSMQYYTNTNSPGHISVDCGDSVKWYDVDDDMLALSRLFLGATFEIHVDGEAEDDFWEARYRNGNVEKRYGEIVYPDWKMIL